MSKIIITAAVNGNRDQSYGMRVPITPEEIAEESRRCVEAGASVIHFHARDADTGHATFDLQNFSETIAAIGSRCNAIVETTTGGGPKVDPKTRRPLVDPETGLKIMPSDEERLGVLNVSPPQEMFNVAVGSLNAYIRGAGIDGMIYTNSPYYCRRSAEILSNKPNSMFQFEIFDLGFLHNVKRLADEGHLNTKKPNFWFNFCLGYGGCPAEPPYLTFLLHEMQTMFPGRPWGVNTDEENHFPMSRLGAQLGELFLRTGYEDTARLPDGGVPRSNADLVAVMVDIAKSCGREVATVDEAREILGLEQRGQSRRL